ncbi:uncharacterized protein [Montipora foliosa]|uniref:uncharacterized protein n=1 Tax=Montipora foliosa TaxID=591990 RepID=UPI0035F12CAD
MRLLLAEGGSCLSYWTAAWEALPFPIREDVTCLPVREKGDGYAAPVNLVSSVGNAEKPTVHGCSTEEINQWKQQLKRSKPRTKPLKARQKKNARNPSFTLKITEVARHREHETPVFTDSVYNAHQEQLVGIRIYPKGVRNGTSTRVALFMHMIKGGFDNFLVWPFDGTITVSVLDQSDCCSRRDLSRIIEGNPVLPAFQQPDLSICRTGYGYERFAPIEEFFGPRYVIDDKLVLKIEFPGGMIDTLTRPLRTDFMMSLGSRNDNSNKGKLNMFQPVVSSFVGNTKINRENCGMVESVFIDQTDCKIKDNEAKETKVQADSSKTATRIDTGKSLPAFTVDNSQRTRRHASPIRPFTTALMMSGSRKDDRKKGKRNICQPVVSSFVGNAKINREKWGMVKSVFIGQTDCKIKGNEAKETKVQADSSKTATRIDAGKSLPAFTADTSERTRRLASPISSFTTALMMSGSRKDDRKKGKRNICQPVVSSFVGNTKINREKWEMVGPVFIVQTDFKIKGNEAKETKVQADSSKTAARIDAGKSLPAFTADTSERTRRLASPISPFTTALMMSGSRKDDRKKGKRNICQPVVSSFVGNTKINHEKREMVGPVFIVQTDFKIKGNEAKETKVQADSSKTAARIDAGNSLPAFTADTSERTRRLASPISPFTTALMMSGSRKDDRKKGKRNICQPVVSSFVGNTKINHEKREMVGPVFIVQTDFKIKGNEAKETKVQADSSKTAARIDAGKSLPAFTADTSERTRRLASPIRPFTTALMMSGSRKDDRKKGKWNICQPVVSSFVGNTKINREKGGMVKSVFIGQTDCKIKGNEAKQTKVQADSSKTAARIDAGKSLPAFTADTSERTRRLASPIRSKPLKARKEKNTRDPSGTFKITKVARHREKETPIFTDAVYNDHQEKLFDIRIHLKGVGSGANTKINREKWGMVKSVFIGQTDCKIKGNEAKETKVQADSSKTATRIDAGKSLPAFTVDNSERTRRLASPIRCNFFI